MVVVANELQCERLQSSQLLSLPGLVLEQNSGPERHETYPEEATICVSNMVILFASWYKQLSCCRALPWRLLWFPVVREELQAFLTGLER